MEVRNSNFDLIRQLTTESKRPDSKKADEKASDELPGFKKLLKDKGQKTEPEVSEEPKDDNNKAMAAAAVLNTMPVSVPEAILNLDQMAAGMKIVQSSEMPVLSAGEGLIMENQELAVSGADLVQAGEQPIINVAQEALLSVQTEDGEPEVKPSANQTVQVQSEQPVTVMTAVQQEEQPQDLAAIQQPKDSGNNQEALTEENNLPVEVISGAEELHQNKETETQRPEDSMAALSKAQEQPEKTLHIQSDKKAAPVTVKVTEPEELPVKLSDQILKQVRDGKKELEVNLEPANLGKIQIKLSYENNQISISVICSENKTLKMLSQSAGELGTILESSLERPVQIVLDKQEPDYMNEQGQGGHQEQERQQSEEKKDDGRQDFIQKLRLGILGNVQAEAGFTEVL